VNITEANYSGYAQALINWQTIALDPNGRAFAVSDPIPFAHNGGAVGDTVRGYALINIGTQTIIAYESFAPITMAAGGDGFNFIITIYADQLPI
jgi:hypothetical protein